MGALFSGTTLTLVQATAHCPGSFSGDRPPPPRVHRPGRRYLDVCHRPCHPRHAQSYPQKLSTARSVSRETRRRTLVGPVDTGVDNPFHTRSVSRETAAGRFLNSLTHSLWIEPILDQTRYDEWRSPVALTSGSPGSDACRCLATPARPCAVADMGVGVPHGRALSVRQVLPSVALSMQRGRRPYHGTGSLPSREHAIGRLTAHRPSAFAIVGAVGRRGCGCLPPRSWLSLVAAARA
jgi:hypothetical protein